MPRITFIGAGSVVFAKNVLGDCILTPELDDLEIALHDIHEGRLEASRVMVENIVRQAGGNPGRVITTLDRREALKGAKYIINAIRVGEDDMTLSDLVIPHKYGLSQTIADTTGIGGIFKALRTIPTLEDFARDIMDICPDAYFLNYTNPMPILSGYMERFTPVKFVGLCHSVQGFTRDLFRRLEMPEEMTAGHSWRIAGINHMAWVLEMKAKDGTDLYPEVRRRYQEHLDGVRHYKGLENDLVRMDMYFRFGYCITESSRHFAEYNPWYIKRLYPDLIERYNIPIRTTLLRQQSPEDYWKSIMDMVDSSDSTPHARSSEYAAYIIRALEADIPFRIHGNVINNGMISNLPPDACVEIPCMVDNTGINPCHVGALPQQCAAINRSNIGVHMMTIEAARSKKKEDVYMAAMLDPHASAELSQDDIVKMCDELIAAGEQWMPGYR